jgi:hypothetical protein
VSFAAITLCVASQRVFILVYFVIDSVRKLLDTPSYIFVLYFSHSSTYVWNRDSSISVLTRLQARRPGFDSRQGKGRDFLFYYRFQIDSEARPASYPMDTAVFARR